MITHNSFNRIVPVFLLSFGLFWSACSGARTNPRGYDGMMSDYEDFNSASYPVDDPVQEIDHDVPDELMNPVPAGGNEAVESSADNAGNAGEVTGGDVSGNASENSGETGVVPATSGQTREGFRIQIMASDQEGSARRVENEARSWWQNNRSSAPAVLANSFPSYVVYQSPYYKVRIGNFLTRSEADQAVTFLRRMYPDAWVVRDQVIY